MVAVPAHHFPFGLIDAVDEDRIAGIPLPAGGADQRDDAEAVTGVHDLRRLRVVGQPDNIPAGFFDSLKVPILLVVGKRGADPGIVLMTVRPVQE